MTDEDVTMTIEWLQDVAIFGSNRPTDWFMAYLKADGNGVPWEYVDLLAWLSKPIHESDR